MKKIKLLILGASGMLGHLLFNELSKNQALDVHGTVRNIKPIKTVFPPETLIKIRSRVNADKFGSIRKAITTIQPHVVINCIGLIKQLPRSKAPLAAISINASLPHKIALVCRETEARMIHFSTDCVFDGRRGNYTEKDSSTADDYYGRTKYLGEVQYPNSVTLRTSIIGHEIKNYVSLVEWFLSQKGSVRGFSKAIYTGFPSVELANIISNYIIPHDHLTGVYHVSSSPISKFDLLNLIAKTYKKSIRIELDDTVCCDRSLDSTRFNRHTGYTPNGWKRLVEKMYHHYQHSNLYHTNRNMD